MASRRKTNRPPTKSRRLLVCIIVVLAIIAVTAAVAALFIPSYLVQKLSARIIVDNRTHIVNYGTTAVEVETVLLVENKASFPLALKGATYSIFLEDNGNETRMAEGVVTGSFNVPASGNSSTRTRLFIYWNGAYVTAWKWLTGFMARKEAAQPMMIMINGTMDFDLGLLGSLPEKFSINQTIP